MILYSSHLTRFSCLGDDQEALFARVKSPLQWIQSKKFNLSSPFLFKDRDKDPTENVSLQRQQTLAKAQQQELDVSQSDRLLDQSLDKYLTLANLKESFHQSVSTEFADKVDKLKDTLSLYIRDYETMKEGTRWYIDKLDLVSQEQEQELGNNKRKALNKSSDKEHSRTNESGEIVEMQENDMETEDKDNKSQPSDRVDSLLPLRTLLLTKSQTNVAEQDIVKVQLHVNSF